MENIVCKGSLADYLDFHCVVNGGGVVHNHTALDEISKNNIDHHSSGAVILEVTIVQVLATQQTRRFGSAIQ